MSTSTRSIKIAAASAAVGAAVSVVGTVALVRHLRRRKRRKGQFLSTKRRQTITDALELASEEIPHGAMGTRLFHSRLQQLSDKRLLTLYAALRIGEFMRESGIDPLKMTADQLAGVRARFAKAEDEGAHDRSGMLDALLAHDVEEVKPLLPDNLCYMLVNGDPREAISVEFEYELLDDGTVHQTQIDIDVRTPDLLAEDFVWINGKFDDFVRV